ncbi:hypothetical protein UlMin_009243 [Ulmus minor]
MAISAPSLRLFALLALAMFLAMPVYGQISTPCNASTIAFFTPCMNFLTNSSSNGNSPTANCCNALKSLTGSGMDCFCLILTGSVPFQIPINRTLAISLPRACNMPGVPLQCKANGSPLPAPGPASLGPTLSPGASPSANPTPGSSIPEPISPALSPEADTPPLLTPPSTTSGAESPTETTGSRQALDPSAAMPSCSFPPYILQFAIGFLFMKFC